MSGEGEAASPATLNAARRVEAVAEVIGAYWLKYERAHDERAVFAFVYQNLTQRLAEQIRDGSLTFDDPEWIATLDESFAAQFFRAMDSIDLSLEDLKNDKGSSAKGRLYELAPKPWADVYLAIRHGQSYVLEDLLFSMMAHISYDLPLALLEAKMETLGRSHVADYHRMNEVLAGQTDAIEAAVAKRYNRFLGFLDKIAGHYDEFFSDYGIRIARSLAWYNACRLLDQTSKEAAQQSILRSTGGFIRLVRNPKGRWLPLFVRTVRLVVPPRRRWPRQNVRT